MDNSRINVAVILSARDQMSQAVNASVNKSVAYLQRMKIASANMMSFGKQSMITGAVTAAPLIAMAKSFGDQENAMLQMKAEMLQDGNKFNAAMFKQLNDFAKKSTDTYGGTAEAYFKMIRVLRENSIDPKEILGGIGDAVEQLSVVFEMQPEKIGQFAARMKQDMGVTTHEMQGMMDFIARLKNAGVGKDGEEAVTEMSEAFSKAGLGAHNLGVQGLQASKDLGALMGIFVRRGISGSTVGNNFRRIFDGLRDAEKLKKANDVARQFGVTLDFYDKDHKFKGIAAFAGELSKLGPHMDATGKLTRGLSTTQISEVLKPFSGKQGLSTDFLEFLANEGMTAFNEFNHKLATQGTLAQKVDVIMSGLNRQFDRTHSKVINAAADIGSTYAPQLKSLLIHINNLIGRISLFTRNHQTLTRVMAMGVGIFAALASTLGVVSYGAGVLTKTWGILTTVIGYSSLLRWIPGFFGQLAMKLVSIVVPAMISFTATVWANAAAWLANPVTWIILAIIAAIGLLVAAGIWMYNHWDKILKWLKMGWALLKGSVVGLIAVFNLFLDVIVGVGKALIGAFTFDPKMMIAGAKQAANAVNKIANGGISTTFNQAAMASYKDTMGIKDRPANVPVKPKLAANTTTHYHFSPNITAGPGATTKDAHSMADLLKPHFNKMIKEHEERKKRVGYN